MDLVCSGAVLLLFVFLCWFGATDWNVSSLFGFLAEWSLRLAEDSIEWAFVVCDSSFLCNPLESKGGIKTYNKRGPTPSLTS